MGRAWEVSFVVWGEPGRSVLSCGESLGGQFCREGRAWEVSFVVRGEPGDEVSFTKLSLCERHVLVLVGVRGGKGGEGGEGYLIEEDGVSGKVCEVLELKMERTKLCQD